MISPKKTQTVTRHVRVGVFLTKYGYYPSTRKWKEVKLNTFSLSLQHINFNTKVKPRYSEYVCPVGFCRTSRTVELSVKIYSDHVDSFLSESEGVGLSGVRVNEA